TSHCDDQATPRLTVQNITLAHGNSTGQRFDGGGGGAIFDRGGQLRVVDATFTGNRCDPTGPDLGGAAVRALSQYQARPVYVVGSRFDANACSNGAALSSIGVSWTVLNSRFTNNRAVGRGANPARPGAPGGGGQHLHAQPRQRGRRGDLLRLQRPNRDDVDHGLDPQGQPQRRVPHLR